MEEEDKTFRIEIHVAQCRAKEGSEVIKSMICNFKEWEKGKECLKYKLGEHISNNLHLVIDPSMLND